MQFAGNLFLRIALFPAVCLYAFIEFHINFHLFTNILKEEAIFFNIFIRNLLTIYCISLIIIAD